MKSGFVRLDVDASGAAELWLMRPDKRNALTPEMIDDLLSAVTVVSETVMVRGMLLAADGPAFCAGGDVSLVAQRSAIEQRDLLQRGYHAVARAMHRLDKPIVAAINGPAVGAGVDLALFADVVFASPSASFDLAYPRIGLIPGDAAAWFLPRRIGSRALEFAWRRQPTTSSEALALGLVSRVVPEAELHDSCRAYLHDILLSPSVAVERTKRLLRHCMNIDLDSALDLMAAEQALMHDTPARRAIAAAGGARTRGSDDERPPS